MGTRYTQLQAEERMTLSSLHQQGWSLRAMGRLMGRSASTLCRELLKAGYTAAKLSGGVSSWKADNLPLVK